MKSKLFLVTAFLSALLFAGCKSNNDPESPDATDVYTQEGCMYVGITGFNNQLYYYTGNPDKRYNILSKSTVDSYTDFIKSLSMAKNTALFWAVEDNVNHLGSCQFPADIENVSIVTFTDGLENGSGDFDARFIDIADYETNLDFLNDLISKTYVQGVKLTAYTVGVQGSDVTNVKRFDNTLEKLSSGEGYHKKVDNMAQLNETFKEIANDLYKQNSKPQLTVAVPPQVRKERIVFDQKTATESKIYIEATKLKESPLKYSNITYVGCKSDSGNEVQGSKNSEGSTVFVFDNFTDLNGEKLSYVRTDLWYWDGSEWAHDAEYDGQNGARTEDVHKSAAIMLILDCSKSLEENKRFDDVKNAAVQFLETLAGSVSTNPSGDNDPHCWEVTYTYNGYSETGYIWTTEAQVKQIENEPNISNFTYRRASANDEHSCEALNYSGETDKAQVRFKKEQAYSSVLTMTIDREENGQYVETLAGYEFGEDAGTTSYYEIPSGVFYPSVYIYDGAEYNWYYAFSSPHSYNFQAGKKYTYSCGDDGQYLEFTITLDGTFNAPAKSQVVAKKRIFKSELTKYSKAKVRK